MVRQFHLSTVDNLGQRFEDLLGHHGLTVRPGSILERTVLSTMSLVAKTRGELLIPSDEDIREEFADAVALAELATQVLNARDHESFHELLPHLELLNRTDTRQNRKGLVTDQDANKVFELLVACHTMSWGVPVSVDHPVRSRGDNPDVIAHLPEGSLGIACKVLHSKAPQTILDRVSEAIDQVERADCDTGFVFVNLKNVLDHEAYWPGEQDEEGEWTWGGWRDFDAPVQHLKDELDSIRTALVDHVGDKGAIEAMFDGRRAQPMVFFYAHVVCSVIVDERPATATLRVPWVLAVGSVDANVRTRVKELSHVMQRIPTDQVDPAKRTSDN